MATQSGTIVVFGYTGTDGITATGLTGKGIFTSHEYAMKSDEQQIQGADGKLTTRIFPEDYKTATIEWIPSDSGSNQTVADARAAKTALLGLRHTILNITACDDAPELVDSNWFVVDVKASGSNTGYHKVTLTLESHDGITAAAS